MCPIVRKPLLLQWLRYIQAMPPNVPADAKSRFSTRVQDYIRFRPRYPIALYDFIRQDLGIGQGSVVADIGSGTGMFCQPLLDAGCVVYGVEPNPEMRAAAEQLFAQYTAFHSVDGSGEATTLPDRSADIVGCAQAFHWFDAPKAAAEFVRITRPGGAIAILWNERRPAGSPFLADYESMLLSFGTDYRQVAREHRPMKEADFTRLFGVPFRRAVFPNAQTLDLDGLRGRVMSASYTPLPDQPGHRELLDAIDRLFAAHRVGGRVTIDYDTDVYFARLAR
jgi:SAM-dependent methyltransferase